MNIAVYCGSGFGGSDEFEKSAKLLGEWIGKSGHTLIYGGANKGLMGAVADATLNAGGKVTGVLPNVPLILSRRHKNLTEYVLTETMAERKTEMINRSNAFVALPGGVGTLDEITEILSLQSLNIINAPIVFYNTNGYYEPMKRVIENIVANDFGKTDYFSKVLFSDDINEIAKFIEG